MMKVKKSNHILANHSNDCYWLESAIDRKIIDQNYVKNKTRYLCSL